MASKKNDEIPADDISEDIEDEGLAETGDDDEPSDDAGDADADAEDNEFDEGEQTTTRSGAGDGGDSDGDAPVFGFDDDGDGSEGEPDDNAVLRELRRRTREQARRIKELEQSAPLQSDDPGEKPTLEACGYDDAAYEHAYSDWSARKASHEARRVEAEKQASEQRDAFAARITNFEAKAKELAIPNFNETVEAIAEHFGDDAAGQAAKTFIVYADDPRMVAALHASPARLAHLVSLKNDPIALAIAIGELKGKIRAMPRRNTPEPESHPKGGAPKAAGDKHLEKLEAAAEKSGDRTAIIAYKRKQREKA